MNVLNDGYCIGPATFFQDQLWENDASVFHMQSSSNHSHFSIPPKHW